MRWSGRIVGRWEFEDEFTVEAETQEDARQIALEEARANLPWGAGDADVSVTFIRSEEEK